MSELRSDTKRWLTELDDETTSAVAHKKLSELGPKAVDALPVLLEALGDERYAHRLVVARVLGCMKATGRPAASALVNSLGSGDLGLRRHAALALGRIGADDPEIVERLRGLIDDDDPYVSVASASALLQLAPSNDAIETLGRHRQQHDFALNYWAGTGLADAARQGGQVLAAVVGLLDDWDFSIQEYAAESMRECEPEQVMPLLLEALGRGDPALTHGVLRTIGRLGDYARSSAEALEHALVANAVFTSDDPTIRRVAADIVEAVPLESATMLAALVANLDDPDRWVRDRAAEILTGLAGVPADVRERAAKMHARG